MYLKIVSQLKTKWNTRRGIAKKHLHIAVEEGETGRREFRLLGCLGPDQKNFISELMDVV